MARLKTPRLSPEARRSIRWRVVFYGLLGLAAAVSMNREVFTLGIFLLVFPALALAAIHWTFLLLPLVDWPLAAWRRTRRLKWSAAWLGAALVLPVGLPLAFNALQAAHVALDRAGDGLPSAPARPSGTILVTGDCGAECDRLLMSGAQTRLLRQERSFTRRTGREWADGSIDSATLRYASTYCDDQRRQSLQPIAGHDGWCLVRETAVDPDFGAVLVLEGFDAAVNAGGRRRVEVWSCPGRCRLIARQTERRGAWLSTPLLIEYQGGGLYVDPRLRRVGFRRGDADPDRVIRTALGLTTGGGRPGLGEDPAQAARDEAAFRAAETARAARVEADRLAWLEQSRREEAAAATRLRAAEERRGRRDARDCEVTERDGGFGSVCR